MYRRCDGGIDTPSRPDQAERGVRELLRVREVEAQEPGRAGRLAERLDALVRRRGVRVPDREHLRLDSSEFLEFLPVFLACQGVAGD